MTGHGYWWLEGMEEHEERMRQARAEWMKRDPSERAAILLIKVAEFKASTGIDVTGYGPSAQAYLFFGF